MCPGAAATAWSIATAPSSPLQVSIKGAAGRACSERSRTNSSTAWNVERIRPKTLEPFNFEEANISGELWLAEGFTQYYGELVMQRAGPHARSIAPSRRWPAAPTRSSTDPGRQFHSAVEMSQLAPFTDAATAIDRTNLANTFISYYTYGAAIALALDLSLRDRSNGKISLDDYMRAMWRPTASRAVRSPGSSQSPTR